MVREGLGLETMTQKWRQWIPTVVFWILFAASIGLGKRYPWLDTVWYAAGMLLVLGLSVCSLVYALRHRDETGALPFKGIPRWLERILLDEKPDSRPGNPPD